MGGGYKGDSGIKDAMGVCLVRFPTGALSPYFSCSRSSVGLCGSFGTGEPGQWGVGPVEGRGSNSVLSQANPGPSLTLSTEMGNTLGLAPMGALSAELLSRGTSPQPWSFDELHRLCKVRRH